MSDNGHGFEVSLLESGEFIKRGLSSIANNVGKAVALITLLVACLVTFTEVGFCEFGTESFTSTLILMLTASYLMYFSLEEAGERLGEDSEEFKEASEEYKKAAAAVSPGDINKLREFCLEYTEGELEYRRAGIIASGGLSVSEYARYKNGEKFPTRARRIFKRADREKAATLSPGMLLEKESRHSSELKNPERGKIFGLIIKLIPSSIGMIFTASVMLGAKDGMTASRVIECILKLSTLPIVGFRGYSIGYGYAKRIRPVWIHTKTRLLLAFSEKEAKIDKKEQEMLT